MERFDLNCDSLNTVINEFGVNYLNLNKNEIKILGLFLYLYGLDKKNEEGYFFIEDREIQRITNINQKITIRLNIRKLIEKGYLDNKITGKQHSPNKYLISEKTYNKIMEEIEENKSQDVSFKSQDVSFKSQDVIFHEKLENQQVKVQDVIQDVSFKSQDASLNPYLLKETKQQEEDIDKDIEEDIDKDIEEDIDNIKYNKNNNIINTGKSMREPNVELMNNLIKSIESLNESLQLMNSSIKENSNKIEIINETLQLMNSTNSDNFNKLINKIDSLKDSSKVNDTEDTLGNDTNSSSESESVEEQSNLESESAEDEIKDDSNNESEPIEPETTNNNKPSIIEIEKEKGCAEREKETTEELPNGAIQFTTSVDLEKYIAQNKLSSLENWGKYKIDIDNLVIVPTEMTQEANKSNPEPSNDAGGIVDHTGENKPNLPIPNEPTEDELKFEKRKQKAKELVSRLINEHMTNEQEFNEYFNKGFMWCKKFQLETYYVKLVEKYKPDVDTTEVEEDYALNDIFSNAA